MTTPLAYSYATPTYSVTYGAPAVFAAAPVVAKAVAAPVAAVAAPVLAKAVAAPVAAVAAPVVVDTEYDPYPTYAFGYNVYDVISGDSKTQEETRVGDVVRGSYSMIEADGSRRIVSYVADPINGFNAVVQKDAPVVAAVAAPVVANAAFPLAYAAPVVAAPVAVPEVAAVTDDAPAEDVVEDSSE